MPKLTAVTNRGLCRGDFLTQIERLCEDGVDCIILREKDMAESEYENLAAQVFATCRNYGTKCILHTYPNVAARLGTDGVHLPLPMAQQCITEGGWKRTDGVEEHNLQLHRAAQERCAAQRRLRHALGISVHSIEQARQAAALGADYLTAGHIFATDCKRDLAPRGLEFLAQIVEAVSIPVYAIGGINTENAKEVLAQGAAGICIMSGLMNATPGQIRAYHNCTILGK